jgi:hypothetical protein
MWHKTVLACTFELRVFGVVLAWHRAVLVYSPNFESVDIAYYQVQG